MTETRQQGRDVRFDGRSEPRSCNTHISGSCATRPKLGLNPEVGSRTDGHGSEQPCEYRQVPVLAAYCVEPRRVSVSVSVDVDGEGEA